MKKCFYFPTWREEKDVMVSLDENYLIMCDILKRNLNNITMFIVDYPNFSIDGYAQSTPSDPILAKLCEMIGAKMYGEYVTLESFYYIKGERQIDMGDMFIYDISYTDDIGVSIPYYDTYYACFDNAKYNIKKEDEEIYKSFLSYSDDESKTTNIFHEYSKFLRKEENRWEEVKELINL